MEGKTEKFTTGIFVKTTLLRLDAVYMQPTLTKVVWVAEAQASVVRPQERTGVDCPEDTLKELI